MGEVAQAKRPGVVTFIGIVIYVQALMAAVISVMTFINRDDSHWQSSTGQSADGLLAIAISEAILAVILFVTAANLMRGGRSARTFVGVVMVLRIGVAAWAMVAHHGGGIFGAAVMYILIALFVLWALYGNEASEAYFG